MDSFDFDIKELLDLEQKLKQLPIFVNADVHVEALEKAAVPLRDEIYRNTPVNEGDLREDLAIRKSKFQEPHAHSAIVGFKGGTGHRGHIAKFLEYGTKENGMKKIRERRFIRSSYERTKGEVERKYVEEIQKIVDKKLNGS